MGACPEYSRLDHEARTVLQNLTLVTASALDAFRAGDHATFSRLDLEIEKLVGEKERIIGALRQHAKDHKCVPPAP